MHLIHPSPNVLESAPLSPSPPSPHPFQDSTQPSLPELDEPLAESQWFITRSHANTVMQFIQKIGETILRARVSPASFKPSQVPAPSSLPGVSPSARFTTPIHFDYLLERLDFWKFGLPINVDICLDGGTILLERWVISYEYDATSGRARYPIDSSKDVTDLILLAQSLYSYIRLMPLHSSLGDGSWSRDDTSFYISTADGYSLSPLGENSRGPSGFDLGAKLKVYRFRSAQTLFGKLHLSVVYDSNTSSLLQRLRSATRQIRSCDDATAHPVSTRSECTPAHGAVSPPSPCHSANIDTPVPCFNDDGDDGDDGDGDGDGDGGDGGDGDGGRLADSACQTQTPTSADTCQSASTSRSRKIGSPFPSPGLQKRTVSLLHVKYAVSHSKSLPTTPLRSRAHTPASATTATTATSPLDAEADKDIERHRLPASTVNTLKHSGLRIKIPTAEQCRPDRPRSTPVGELGHGAHKRLDAFLCPNLELFGSLVGSYEESILSGRMSTLPSKPISFIAEIGVIGLAKCKSSLKCPPHLTLPFHAYFYELPGDESPSTPYVGTIYLQSQETGADGPGDGIGNGHSEVPVREELTVFEPDHTRFKASEGYRLPGKGQLQVIIKNQSRTAAKVFLLQYDFRDMPPNTKTFLRQKVYTVIDPHDRPELRHNAQRTANDPSFAKAPAAGPREIPSAKVPSGSATDAVGASAKDAGQRFERLRNAIHLQFHCTSKRRLYLSKSIRVVFSHRNPDGEEKIRVVCEGPQHPKYIPVTTPVLQREAAPPDRSSQPPLHPSLGPAVLPNEPARGLVDPRPGPDAAAARNPDSHAQFLGSVGSDFGGPQKIPLLMLSTPDGSARALANPSPVSSPPESRRVPPKPGAKPGAKPVTSEAIPILKAQRSTIHSSPSDSQYHSQRLWESDTPHRLHTPWPIRRRCSGLELMKLAGVNVHDYSVSPIKSVPVDAPIDSSAESSPWCSADDSHSPVGSLHLPKGVPFRTATCDLDMASELGVNHGGFVSADSYRLLPSSRDGAEGWIHGLGPGSSFAKNPHGHLDDDDHNRNHDCDRDRALGRDDDGDDDLTTHAAAPFATMEDLLDHSHASSCSPTELKASLSQLFLARGRPGPRRTHTCSDSALPVAFSSHPAFGSTSNSTDTTLQVMRSAASIPSTADRFPRLVYGEAPAFRTIGSGPGSMASRTESREASPLIEPRYERNTSNSESQGKLGEWLPSGSDYPVPKVWTMLDDAAR